jgi:adenine deaminase
MPSLSGHIVDLVSESIFPGNIEWENGKIRSVTPRKQVDHQYILPGLIDAHLHVESSMMPPSELARLVLPHGTIACVCDPHEIANVCGIPGIHFMIENGESSPMYFFFGMPSCVPATPYETAGAILDAKAVELMLQRKDIYFLAEMMNFPGVLQEIRK